MHIFMFSSVKYFFYLIQFLFNRAKAGINVIRATIFNQYPFPVLPRNAAMLPFQRPLFFRPAIRDEFPV